MKRYYTCAICGERVDILSDEAAEMYDPKLPTTLNIIASAIVHGECGVANGWEVA